MPSIAEAVSPISNKRRRREDFSNGVELQLKVSSFAHPCRSYENFPLNNDSDFKSEPYSRHFLSPKRRSHDSKRQRVGHLTSDTGREVYFAFEPRENTSIDRHSITSKQTEVSRVTGMIDLSPCHICRRKPTVKSELDGFGNCESCGERTCYICMRRCEGPGLALTSLSGRVSDYDADSMVIEITHPTGTLGMDLGHKSEDESGTSKHRRTDDRHRHKDQICSACCLERGSEGEIWCLGCLRAEEAV